MKISLARWVRSSGWSLIAYAVQILTAIVVSVLVFRGLGEIEFGRLSLLRQLLALVVVLAGFALERAVVRYLPELADDPGAQRRLVVEGLVLRVVSWTLFFVLGWLCTGWLEDWVLADSQTSLRIALGTALSFSLYAYLRAAATARLETRAVALSTVLGSLISLVLTLVALDRGWGVDGILAANGIGLMAAAMGMLPAALGAAAPDELPSSEPPELRFRSARVQSYVLPFAAITILNFVVHSATEVFFLGHFHGEAAAGHFRLGFDFAARIIDFLPLALWEVSMAGFATMALSHSDALQEAVRKYVVLLYLIMGPVAAIGVALVPTFFGLLYGAESQPAQIVAQGYFLVAGFTAVGAPLGMVLYARERVGTALLAYLVFSTANVLLDLWWIPRFGIGGALAGLVAAKLLAVALLGSIAARELGGLQLPAAYLTRLGMALLLPLAFLLVDQSLPGMWAAILGVVGCPLILLVGVRLFRVIGPEEASLLRRTEVPGINPLLRWMGAGAA